MGSQRQARLLVLEGLDGAGTTTQTRLLADALAARDVRVCSTAEPTDGPLGLVLRAHVRGEIALDPMTTALTFTADRADHLARVIRPALERGEWVVSDRYLLSTVAYQGAEGVDRAWILDLSAGFAVPDLTFYLDVPPDELARRLDSRERSDRYEGRELTQALRRSYDESIAQMRGRGHPIEVVDGSQMPADVLKDLLSRLDALL